MIGGAMQLDLLLPFERKVEIAIERFRTFAPKDGTAYVGCFSGGKDSTVIKELGRLSGVPIEWHYNVTTIDPPELLAFIRKHHPDVIWERSPHGSLIGMVRKKWLPTRHRRWCCELFKESYSPEGRIRIMGVRAAESARRRSQWKMLTYHTRNRAHVLCPIIDWNDDDVWEFIRSRSLPYCCLYDEGFTRLGCVGCPLAGSKGQAAEFARWPKHAAAWKRAVRELWEARSRADPDFGFKTPEALWEWWTNDQPPEPDECQGVLDLWA